MKTLKWEDDAFTAQENALQEIAYEQWRDSDNAATHKGAALVLPNDVDVASFSQNQAGALAGFDAVILEFPQFKDGRAYSQARRLRTQHGFKGAIIARGDIGRDQALFMLRVGIDVFDVSPERVDELTAASKEFSAFYQTAADQATPVWKRRAKGVQSIAAA